MVVVSCIGHGFVGSSLVNTFSKYLQVKVFDLKPQEPKERVTFVEKLSDLFDSDFIFICLPTPSNPNGSCDTRVINSVLKDLKTDAVIVIKSTVIPGSLDNYQDLKITYNPEFLTERNAFKDFENQDRIFIGGKCAENVSELYQLIGYSKDVIYTEPDLETFQLVKYFNNCFLASKVCLFNEYYNICQKTGVSFEKVRKYICLDPRINSSHTYVPGHDGSFGYGGNCFIKDTKALSSKYDCNILDAVIKQNEINRSK
jgi:UDPglucose 6-dehydrogenase